MITITNPWVDVIMGGVLGWIIGAVIHHRPRIKIKLSRSKITK